MTVVNQTLTSAAPSLRARFDALRTAMAEAARKRRVYTTTLRELETLTFRDLSDMGIDPTSLRKIAYEAAYGK
ncbi:DUF1127 domain-containing protein [Yoonia sp.]|uniref:DUF1127 domain-containing protein n=1 Tax=Yoonia sp. TaxID=2212373 RepID=UPI002FD9504E